MSNNIRGSQIGSESRIQMRSRTGFPARHSTRARCWKFARKVKNFAARTQKGKLPPLVIRPSRRVNSYVDLIERFQLPTPLISEDKKRRNPHLAFPSLNKCNVVRATAAAIARGKRNLEGVLPSQRSTEIPGRSSGAAVLTVSPSFYLGRCESPLGNYSNHSHEPS